MQHRASDQGRRRIAGRALLARILRVTVGGAAVTAAAAILGSVVLHIGIAPVLTGSMRPTYGPGDAIVTRQVPVRSLRPGQIAVFTPPGEDVQYAHRITSISGSPAHPTVTTRGDANPVADPWRAQLSGSSVPVVVATVPAAGRLLLPLHDPHTRALLVLLLGLLCTVYGCRRILTTTSHDPVLTH